MGDTAIIHNNIAPGCTGITATNENPDKPITAALNNAPADTFESTAGSSEIVLPFLTLIAFNGAALVNHNFVAGDSVKMRVTNNDFATYDEYTIPIYSSISYLNQGISGINKIKFIITSNRDTISIGQIYIGTYYTFPYSPDFPVKKELIENNVGNKGVFGQQFTKLLSEQWRYDLSYSGVYEEDYTAFRNTLYSGEPKILILDTDTHDALQGEKQGNLPVSISVEGAAFSLSFLQNPYEIY
jgi:hypothetical protein